MPKLPRRESPPETNEIHHSGVNRRVYKGETGDIIKMAIQKPGFREMVERGVIGPEFAKAEFLLTKIMQILFPDNIADMHLAAFTGGTLQSIHKNIPDSLNLQAEEIIDQAIYKKRIAVSKTISGLFSPNGFDSNYDNFHLSSNREPVYVDQFIPWEYNQETKSIEKCYKDDAIRQAIDANLADREKKRALSYLERLNKLYEEAKEKLK